MRAHLVHGIDKRLDESAIGIERHGRYGIGPIGQPLAVEYGPHGVSAHVLRAVEQCQTLLRGQLYWLPAVFAQCLGRAHHLAAIFHLAKAYKRKAQVGQRHKVAGSPQ